MPVGALYKLLVAVPGGLNDWKPGALPTLLFLFQLPVHPTSCPILPLHLLSPFPWIPGQAVMGCWTETCKPRQLGAEHRCGTGKLGREEAEEHVSAAYQPCDLETVSCFSAPGVLICQMGTGTLHGRHEKANGVRRLRPWQLPWRLLSEAGYSGERGAGGD